MTVTPAMFRGRDENPGHICCGSSDRYSFLLIASTSQMWHTCVYKFTLEDGAVMQVVVAVGKANILTINSDKVLHQGSRLASSPYWQDLHIWQYLQAQR
jgi:hypothetical protein